MEPYRRATATMLLFSLTIQAIPSTAALAVTTPMGSSRPSDIAATDSMTIHQFLRRRDGVQYTINRTAGDPVQTGTNRYRFTNGGVEYVCETTSYHFAQNNERIIDPNPGLATLWPGALVRTKDIERGALTEVSLPRRTFTIRMQPQNNVSGSVIATVRADVVQDSITALRSRNTAQSADVSFLKTEHYSSDQASTRLGLSGAYSGLGGGVSDERSSIREENQVAADFQQVYYHVFVQAPTHAGSFLDPAVDTTFLKSILDDNEPLGYVADIAYGRRAFILIRGKFSHTQLKSALSFAYSQATGSADPELAQSSPDSAGRLQAAARQAADQQASARGSLSEEMTNVLRNSSIEVRVLGGPDGPAVTLAGHGALIQFIHQGVSATSTNPGHPLTYTVRNVAGNDIIRFGNSADYGVFQCRPYEAVIQVTFESIWVHDDCEGGNDAPGEFFWTFKLDDDVLHEIGEHKEGGGFGHDFGESRTVRRFADDDAPDIRIHGWMKESDDILTFNNDDVGSFDRRLSYLDDRWGTNKGSGANKGVLNVSLGSGECRVSVRFRIRELGMPTGSPPTRQRADRPAFVQRVEGDGATYRARIESGTVVPGRPAVLPTPPTPAPPARPSQEIPLDPGNGGRSVTPRALIAGDLIVATSSGFTSAATRWATGGGPASHVMLYDGNGNVLEALPGAGVTLRPLATALSDASFAVALRVPGTRSAQRVQAVQMALTRLGSSYDYIGAIEQARFTFNGGSVVPNLGPGSDMNRRYFCSELVIEAFDAVGIQLATVGPRSPNDLMPLTWVGALEYVGHLKYPR